MSTLSEIMESIKPELMKIQEEMYFLGKKDCLESLKTALSVSDESIFKKQNILGLVDILLKECSKGIK